MNDRRTRHANGTEVKVGGVSSTVATVLMVGTTILAAVTRYTLTFAPLG